MAVVERNRLLFLIAALAIGLLIGFLRVDGGGGESPEPGVTTLSSARGIPASDANAPAKQMEPNEPGAESEGVVVTQGLGPESMDVLPGSLSQLPRAELEQAFSSMTGEYGRWLSLRTIRADAKIAEASYLSDGTPQAKEWMARLTAEIIPLREKINGRCVKIRVRLESDEHGVIVAEDVLDHRVDPAAWSMKREGLRGADVSQLWDLYHTMPWQSIFMMVDSAQDDFREFQRAGVTDVHQMAAFPWAMKWTPLRASTPQEEQEFFAGQRQYLTYFFPKSLHELWFSAETGEITRVKLNASETNPRTRIIQAAGYTDGGSSETHFPTSVTVEEQDVTGKDKPIRTTVSFSNVRLNDGVSAQDFASPSKAVRL